MSIYSPEKCANLLDYILSDIEKRTGRKRNYSKISKQIGISRTKLADMVTLSQRSYQEPSITLLSSIIDYFRAEGYAITYDNFVEEKKKIDDMNNIDLYRIFEYELPHDITPLWLKGFVFSLIKKKNLENKDVLLCKDDCNHHYLYKYLADEKIYLNMSTRTACEDLQNLEIIGRVIYIKII
jgi:hypothetical protein